MTEQDAKVEEALRKMEEANKKLAAQRASQPQTPSPNHKPHSDNKSFLSNLNTKLFHHNEEEEAPAPVPMEIGVPTNVTHEGHISFDKNEGFKLRNLPPQYQKLFEDLNKTLMSMGVSSVTEKEAKFLLRSLPSLIPSAQPQEKHHDKKTNKAHDRTEQFIQDLILHKKQLETKNEVLEEEVKRLRQQLKQEQDKNFQLEQENSKIQIRATEIGELKSHQDIEKKVMSKLDEELKKFHKQLDEKVKEIQKLLDENDELKVGLAQLKVINIEKTNNNKDVSPVRVMKKKGETVVLSGESKNQIKTTVKEIKSVPTAPPPPTSDLPPPPPPPIGDAPPPPPAPVKEKKEAKPKAPPKEPKPAPAVGRDDLMENIRKGQKLRHVTEEDKKPQTLDLDDQNVLNLIAKALIQRRGAIKEEEEEADDDNLEDWM